MDERKRPLGGTLKVEIIKPADARWDDVGPRMRALRSTLGYALNATQERLWPGLQACLEKARAAKTPQDKKAARAAKDIALAPLRKVLKEEWNRELDRLKDFRKSSKDENVRKRPWPDSAFADVLDCVASETEDLLKSRWNKDHFKDLLANRASVPSWSRNSTFSAESRHCRLSGPPDKARLIFPLFGMGRKATEFVVAPCGRGHEALWARMTDPGLQAQRAALAKERDAEKRKGKAADQVLISDLTRRIEKLEAVKVGRVGMSYDERRRKWYALISWTQEREAVESRGQVAVCNFGIDRLVLLMAQDTSLLDVSGQEILAARRRFGRRRRQISRRVRGPASFGRGKARRELALTKLGDRESQFATTFIRQSAARIAKWCRDQGVATLYLEELKEVRDSDDGTEHVNVRRLLHSWAYYEFGQAVKRACDQVNVTVEMKEAWYVSQECPWCGFTDEGNVRKEELRADTMVVDGRPYHHFEVRHKFQCLSCERRVDSDLVACVNHFKHLGVEVSLDHVMTEKRRQIVRKAEAEMAVQA